MTEWVTKNDDTPVCYHISKDCKAAGDDLRPITEHDRRRNIRKCSYCAGSKIPELD